jgi:hypothetical protein
LSGARALGKGAISFNRAGWRADEGGRLHSRPMNSPFHLFRLQPAPTQRDSETVHVATESDLRRGTAIFRAPALPTPHQLSSDLPFTVNFRPRLRERP